MQSGVMPSAKCLDWDASAPPRGKGREDKFEPPLLLQSYEPGAY